MKTNGWYKYLTRGSLFSLIISVCLASIISGCAISNSQPVQKEVKGNIPQATGNPGKVKITFSYFNESIGNDMELAVKKFNEENQTALEVSILKIPWDKYDETLNMLMTSGEGPDVFEIGKEWIDGYTTKKWLADISDVCDKAFLIQFPGWVEPYVHGLYSDQGLYTFPGSMMTMRLIYNKDLFRLAGLGPDAAPKTMDELQWDAKQISNSEKGYKKYGFALYAGDGRKCFEQVMESTGTKCGVNYYNFSEGQYNLNVYARWLQVMRNMKEDEALFPGEAILKGDKALLQFAQGNIGMMYANSTIPHILELLKQQTSATFDWGVAMPPAMDAGLDGKGNNSIIPASFYCVNSTGRNTKEAMRFWRYLYSERYQEDMYRKGVMLPILKQVMDNKEDIPNVQNFVQFIPTANDAVFPAPPRIIDDWTRFDSYIESIEGSKSVNEVLKSESDSLNFDFNSIIDGGQVNSNTYKNPEFDWLNPMKSQ